MASSKMSPVPYNGTTKMGRARQSEETKTNMEGGSDMDEVRRKSEVAPKSSSHGAYYPSFFQHFFWYFLNVFVRFLLEALFVVMQVKLYGFEVNEKYQCEQSPCPNKVDCFVSRPMEKTIFLWFMLVYSCICVLLNFFELIYLLYAWAFKYSDAKAASRKYSNIVKHHKRKPSTFPVPLKTQISSTNRKTLSNDWVLSAPGLDGEELENTTSYGSRPLLDTWACHNKRTAPVKSTFVASRGSNWRKYFDHRALRALDKSDIENGHNEDYLYDDDDDGADMDMNRDEMDDIDDYGMDVNDILPDNANDDMNNDNDI